MLSDLQNDIDVARRGSDAPRLKVLTLLMSKVQRLAKDDGNRAATEDDLIAGVSRYRKEVDEMRAVLVGAGRPTDEQDAELAIVSAYLPKQLTDDELDAEIEKALEDTARDKKAMGVVMKHLNGGFRGMFDPKAANARISAKLS
jgi:uncharacterized protein YqeY